MSVRARVSSGDPVTSDISRSPQAPCPPTNSQVTALHHDLAAPLRRGALPPVLLCPTSTTTRALRQTFRLPLRPASPAVSPTGARPICSPSDRGHNSAVARALPAPCDQRHGENPVGRQATPRGRNWTLTRGPTGLAVLGMQCSQVRWQDPPITIRSP